MLRSCERDGRMSMAMQFANMRATLACVHVVVYLVTRLCAHVIILEGECHVQCDGSNWPAVATATVLAPADRP